MDKLNDKLTEIKSLISQNIQQTSEIFTQSKSCEYKIESIKLDIGRKNS